MCLIWIWRSTWFSEPDLLPERKPAGIRGEKKRGVGPHGSTPLLSRSGCSEARVGPMRPQTSQASLSPAPPSTGTSGRRFLLAGSSIQKEMARATAPQEMAMSATLKIGQSMKPRLMGPMKSTTPRSHLTRSMRFPRAPASTRERAKIRNRSLGSVWTRSKSGGPGPGGSQE